MTQPGRPVRAVVFDLFGTLISYPPGAPHVHAMADRLGVEFERLRPAWSKTRARRDAGELDARQALLASCEELGIRPSEDKLRAARAELIEFLRGILVPREGAIEALRTLRERGLKIGLVSDATVEVARLWASTAFAPFVDAPVFSCEQRVRKPDPALYLAVCERLAVRAGDSLYVGNGDGDELAGALTAGMRALLFTAPGEYPGRKAAGWKGPRISDLREVLTYAQRSPSRGVSELEGRPAR